MINMTAEEKAYFESGGNADPYPGEKVETPAEPPVEPTEPVKEEAKVEEPAEPEKPETEEGEEEEIVDVANKEGETRRKMIAFGAYEKQRKASKAKDDTISQLQQKLAYFEGLQHGQQPPQTQQTQELSLTPPDKTKEPEKYLAWLETAAAKALQFEKQTQAQTEQNSQFQQLNEMVIAHEQAFVNGDPENGIEAHSDFLEAVNFLQNKQKAELREAGYEPHEIAKILAARAQDVSLRALRAGDSPARRVYALAKLNGYKKPAPAKPAETEAEKITRQAKNQEKAGKTISALPGGESKGLTPEALANMDPAAFQKLWESGEAKSVIGWVD